MVKAVSAIKNRATNFLKTKNGQNVAKAAKITAGVMGIGAGLNALTKDSFTVGHYVQKGFEHDEDGNLIGSPISGYVPHYEWTDEPSLLDKFRLWLIEKKEGVKSYFSIDPDNIPEGVDINSEFLTIDGVMQISPVTNLPYPNFWKQVAEINAKINSQANLSDSEKLMSPITYWWDKITGQSKNYSYEYLKDEEGNILYTPDNAPIIVRKTLEEGVSQNSQFDEEMFNSYKEKILGDSVSEDINLDSVIENTTDIPFEGSTLTHIDTNDMPMKIDLPEVDVNKTTILDSNNILIPNNSETENIKDGVENIAKFAEEKMSNGGILTHIGPDGMTSIDIPVDTPVDKIEILDGSNILKPNNETAELLNTLTDLDNETTEVLKEAAKALNPDNIENAGSLANVVKSMFEEVLNI